MNNVSFKQQACQKRQKNIHRGRVTRRTSDNCKLLFSPTKIFFKNFDLKQNSDFFRS